MKWIDEKVGFAICEKTCCAALHKTKYTHGLKPFLKVHDRLHTTSSRNNCRVMRVLKNCSRHPERFTAGFTPVFVWELLPRSTVKETNILQNIFPGSRSSLRQFFKNNCRVEAISSTSLAEFTASFRTILLYVVQWPVLLRGGCHQQEVKTKRFS